MPYDMKFTGSYFDVANFLKGVDDLVHLQQSGQVAADGGLVPRVSADEVVRRVDDTMWFPEYPTFRRKTV